MKTPKLNPHQIAAMKMIMAQPRVVVSIDSARGQMSLNPDAGKSKNMKPLIVVPKT